MTDYNIKNTDINEENNFREWERLVMDYEPVRRNLYEVYCKSLEKKQTNLFTGGDFNTEPIYTEPIVEPEPKPIVEPKITINTSFLNRQLQELKNEEEEPEPKKTFSDWRPVGFPNGPLQELENCSSDDCFSSDEEELVVEEVVEEEVKTTEELTQQLVDKNLKYSKAQDDRIQRNIDELQFRPDPTKNLGLQFFRLEIPKMKLEIKLYHKNTANKHISFTTDSCELYKQIVIQKEKKFWINLIDGNPNVTPIQLNKTQKEILLAAYPYDKKRLPTMLISHIRD